MTQPLKLVSGTLVNLIQIVFLELNATAEFVAPRLHLQDVYRNIVAIKDTAVLEGEIVLHRHGELFTTIGYAIHNKNSFKLNVFDFEFNFLREDK